MNYAAFLQLVSEMRVAQNVYFKTRTNGALIAAKELEKKVDAVIKAESISLLADQIANSL